jgi:hypothetical protein
MRYICSFGPCCRKECVINSRLQLEILLQMGDGKEMMGRGVVEIQRHYSL